MVRGKTSTPISAGLHIRTSSPNSSSKLKIKQRFNKNKKISNNCSSRSPSPATAVLNQNPGHSESLQLHKVKSKKLRKHETDNGFKVVASKNTDEVPTAPTTTLCSAIVSENSSNIAATTNNTLKVSIEKVVLKTSKKSLPVDKSANGKQTAIDNKVSVSNGKLNKMSKKVTTSDVPPVTKHKILDEFHKEEPKRVKVSKKATNDVPVVKKEVIVLDIDDSEEEKESEIDEPKKIAKESKAPAPSRHRIVLNCEDDFDESENEETKKNAKESKKAPVASKHRIVLNFEDDSDESENEELKRTVEDIEKNLNSCEERPSKGRKSSSDSTDITQETVITEGGAKKKKKKVKHDGSKTTKEDEDSEKTPESCTERSSKVRKSSHDMTNTAQETEVTVGTKKKKVKHDGSTKTIGEENNGEKNSDSCEERSSRTQKSALDSTTDNVQDNEATEETVKKKKKKKKKKEKRVMEVEEDDSEENSGFIEEKSSKRRKTSFDSTDTLQETEITDGVEKKKVTIKFSLKKPPADEEPSLKNGQKEKLVVEGTTDTLEENTKLDLDKTIEDISEDEMSCNDGSVELIDDGHDGQSKEEEEEENEEGEKDQEEEKEEEENKMDSKEPEITEKPTDNLISSSSWEDISDDEEELASSSDLKTKEEEVSIKVKEPSKESVANEEHPSDDKENLASKENEECPKDDSPQLMDVDSSKEKTDHSDGKEREKTGDVLSESLTDKSIVVEDGADHEPKEVIEDESIEKTADVKTEADTIGCTSILKRKLMEDVPHHGQSDSSAEKKLKLDDGQNGQHLRHTMHGFMRRVFGLKRQAHFLATEQTNSVAAVKAVSEDDKENAVTTDGAKENDIEPTVVDEKEVEATEEKRVTKKDKEKTYQLSKAELEMLVMSKVTEYFTDGNKSEIGALRRRCEQLEKALEQWRRKANICQKQVTDLQIVIQRAQLNKKQVKPPMRSVGLQVQLTRYIPVSSDASRIGAPRVATVSNSTTTTTGQRVIIPQPMSTNSLSFVTNLGSTVALSGTYVAAKPVGVTSNVGNVLSSRTMITGSPMNTRPGMPVAKSPSNQFGISLLQPRPVCSTSQTLVFSSPIVTNAVATMPRTSSLTTPLVVTSVHPALEPNKIVTGSSAATPVPMRLVPNQASRSTTAGNTNATLSPAKNALVGQPQVAAAAVKFIDLAAEEEEQIRTAPSFAVSNVANALTVVPSLTGTNTVTVLTPSSSSSSSGQLLTINSSAQNAFTTSAAIRMGAPARPPNGLVSTASINTTPMRLAYLMPSTSVTTMVRPNQSMIVGQSPIQRQPGTILRPAISAIVYQRGTTLIPVQQSQMSSLQPGTIVSNVRPVTTTTTSAVRSVNPNMISSPQVSRLAIAPKAIPVTSMPSGPPPLNTQSLMQKAVFNAASVGKTHPAPLPAQPKYPEPTTPTNRKALPSKPALKISRAANGIVLSWNMTISASIHAPIFSYQLYAYQEGTGPPSTTLWKKVGNVDALPLPMACTLTQFVEGHKYYFAVRAVDVHNRVGPFSEPGSIALVQPNSKKT